MRININLAGGDFQINSRRVDSRNRADGPGRHGCTGRGGVPVFGGRVYAATRCSRCRCAITTIAG